MDHFVELNQRGDARTNFRPARARSAQKSLRARAQKFSCCSKKNNTLLKFEQQLCTKYQINGLKINGVVMYKVFNEFLIPYYTLTTLTNQNGYGIMQHFLRARKNSCARSRSAQPFLRAQQDFLRARVTRALLRLLKSRDEVTTPRLPVIACCLIPAAAAAGGCCWTWSGLLKSGGTSRGTLITGAARALRARCS